MITNGADLAVLWRPAQLSPPQQDNQRSSDDIARAASAFEAMFVADMLSQAGLGQMPEGFGGGYGEEAFSSFLSQAFAEKIAASGQLGLAEAIMNAIASSDEKPEPGL